MFFAPRIPTNDSVAIKFAIGTIKEDYLGPLG